MTDNHTSDEQIEAKDTGTQGDQSAQDSTQKTVTIDALQEQIQMLQKQYHRPFQPPCIVWATNIKLHST